MTFHENEEITRELNKQIDNIFFKYNHPFVFWFKMHFLDIFSGFIIGIILQIGVKIWF